MKRINTLCIVDDDSTFQFLTRTVIEESQLVERIKIFSNGKAAIDFLTSTHDQPEELPEIILLDLNMPILDGWGFLEEYLLPKPRIGKKILICIVSSSIDPEDVEKARTISEVTDCVLKPVTQEKFINLIKTL